MRTRRDIAVAAGTREHLRRPRELLVLREDLPRIENVLRGRGAEERDPAAGLEERLVRFELPQDRGFAGALQELRRAGGAASPARIAPNHVLCGLPYVHGGPASFPFAADPIELEQRGGLGEGVTVAVIDTGYTTNLHTWLDPHTNGGPDTLEDTDAKPANGWIDDQAGHGTFIAGVVASRAPSATIQVTKVLDSEGYGSELDVARAIVQHADADVINLSLGCYSHDDEPPLAIAEALSRVSPKTVVVAAAGNASSSRPLWPAAHKRVLAVGATDASGRPAEFSNYGWWVDAATHGVDVVSTYLEFDESGHKVPIAGRDPQTFKRWARWSGTSFAAPKLAGEIAAELTRGGHGSAREAAAALLARQPTGRLGAQFSF